MAERNVSLEPVELYEGGELPLEPGELTEMRDAWISWELLRRAVCFNTVEGMEPVDIANCCGFDNESAARQRVFKATKAHKVTQSV